MPHGERASRNSEILIMAVCALTTSCARPIVRPSAPAATAREALLVLPGLGYGPDGERALRALAPSMAREGLDLFVPTYVSRAGLVASRAELEEFLRAHRLDRYERLHVFAFIAGAWTMNPLAEADEISNLATIVYDRSPYQERAPRIADEKLHLVTWIRYGRPVFDLARTPYPPLAARSVKRGLLVETEPTRFIRRFAAAARSYGPYRFDCDAFAQPYDDCMYVPMSHDELYVRFAEVWPEVLAFIRAGRFTPAADRSPPNDAPAALSSRGR